MVPQRDDPHAHNEETYDQLISLIENSQRRLAPIIVACDDIALRQRIIARYELEARQAKIRPYQIVLGQEPSLRAGLEALKQQEDYLQQGGKAVFTVTGAELLLRVTLTLQEEQSDLDKFFGYLQWTREGLREFRYPIVLWVSYRILQELSRRAPDFWSWRKAVLRFQEESPNSPRVPVIFEPSQGLQENSEAEFLPPLKELQAEIAALTARDPDAPNLATLYDRLGQVYAQHIAQGIAQNLKQEQDRAIKAFQQAISRYKKQNDKLAQMWTLVNLGNFYKSFSHYQDALNCYQDALDLALVIEDLNGAGANLCNLGHTYVALGQNQKAIDFYQKALEVQRAINNRNFESNSLLGLGNAYAALEKYPKAINFYQQSLEIKRDIGDLQGEAIVLTMLGIAYKNLGQYLRAIDFHQQAVEISNRTGDFQNTAKSLGGLGNVYYLLEQYQRAFEFYRQWLVITRKVGNRDDEARALFNIALALAKLGEPWEALQHYQQAKQIYQILGSNHMVKECDTAISSLNRIIPVQQLIQSPRISEQHPSQRPSSRKRRQPPRGFGS